MTSTTANRQSLASVTSVLLFGCGTPSPLQTTFWQPHDLNLSDDMTLLKMGSGLVDCEGYFGGFVVAGRAGCQNKKKIRTELGSLWVLNRKSCSEYVLW